MRMFSRLNGSILGVLTLVLALSTSASAAQQFTSSVAIGRIFFASGSAVVYFGVTPVPAQTCNFNLVQLQFDTSTPQGKSWYAMLLAAKTSGKTIDIWYEPSSTPGTDQTNGCTWTTVSQVDAIGFSN